MLPGDHAAAARLGALRALEAGTTTLADSGPTGAGAAALAESGLRGLIHLEAFGRDSGAQAVAAAARMAEAVAALDAAVGPRGRAGVSPHAPYTVGPELWAALRAHPGLAGRPWATHLAESADEESVIATGDGPLGALFAGAGLEPGRWEGPPGAGAGGARGRGRASPPRASSPPTACASAATTPAPSPARASAWPTARGRTSTCAAGARRSRRCAPRASRWGSAPTARRAGATTTCARRRGPAGRPTTGASRSTTTRSCA